MKSTSTKLSDRLTGLDTLDKVPVYRFGQLPPGKLPSKYIQIYPTGSVFVWKGKTCKLWNPEIPINLQP